MMNLGEFIFGNGSGMRYSENDQINDLVCDAMPIIKTIAAGVIVVNFVLCLLIAIAGQLVYGGMPFEWQYRWRDFLLSFLQ